MEGPSFYCAYLGYTPVSKSPNNMAPLQTPIKELYFKYRGSPQAGRSASVKLTLTGLLIVLYEDGKIKAEIFFEFAKVQFVEAVKFSSVRGSSDKKPKAVFAPLSEERSGLSHATEKSAFSIEKSFHYLATSTHPPLVTCVVKRPQDGKTIDCHVFALDTVENAFLLTQQVLGHVGPGMAQPRSKNSTGMSHRSPGDVIRTEYGEYSVYRGHANYQGPMGQQGFVESGVNDSAGRIHYQGYEEQTSHFRAEGQGTNLQNRRAHSQKEYQHDGSSDLGAARGDIRPGRHSLPSSQARSGVPGGVILTQEDFNEVSAPQQPPSPRHSPRVGGPFESAGATSAGYGEVQIRRSDSGQRGSQGYEARSSSHSNGNSPRLSSSPNRSRSRPGSGHSSHPVSPHNSGMASPKIHTPASPASPFGHERGGIFSASNLENRVSTGELPPEEDPPSPGRPVAKVPPHMKAGIKVLPSDFHAVKLKHKPEDHKSPACVGSPEDEENSKQALSAKSRPMQGRGEPQREFLSAWENQHGERHLRAQHGPGLADKIGGRSTVSSSQGPSGKTAEGKQGDISDMFAGLGVQSVQQQTANRRQQVGNQFERGLGYLP